MSNPTTVRFDNDTRKKLEELKILLEKHAAIIPGKKISFSDVIKFSIQETYKNYKEWSSLN